MALQITLLLFLFVVLGWAARTTVNALAYIGSRLQVGSFVIGFIVLGLATSTPEFLVGLNSVIDNIPTLSLGNLLGASFVLLTLVTGLSAVMRSSIYVLRSISKLEVILLGIVMLLPVVFAIDGTLSRMDGGVLVAVFFGYLCMMVVHGAHLSAHDTLRTLADNRVEVVRSIGMLIVSLVALVLSSHYAVDIAEQVVRDANIAPFFVGLLLFSVGTNLPELVLAYQSRKESGEDYAFGDVLGSAAANSLIVGIVALFRPIVVSSHAALYLISFFLLVALIAFTVFSFSGRVLTKREGYFMISLYVLFVLSLMFFA